MKKVLKLDSRLSLCESFVESGSKFVDIGTDHGYLAISLVQKGKVQSAIAADVNEGPLESAKQNALKYGVEIKTVLSDGFEKIEENEVTCAVIAGMGGELISKIIEHCSYIKNEGITLILQPMSKPHKLREYLYKNGFFIEKEEAVKYNKKVYSVMLVKYKNQPESCMYMGKIEPLSGFSEDYALGVIKDLENSLKGISGAEKEERQKKIDEIKSIYIDRKVNDMPIKRVKDIYNLIDKEAPFNTAMDFDNVGIIIGSEKKLVKKILLCLDITNETVSEAKLLGADLILSHHPVIFKGLKRIESDSVVSKLIKNDIAALCCHTNLDLSPSIGVNRALCDMLDLEISKVHPLELYYVAKTKKSFDTEEFAEHIKEKLGTKNLMYTNIKKKIKKVALCSGSAGDCVKNLGTDIDAFITGELKYNYFIELREKGIVGFAAGHFETEKIFSSHVKEYLEENLEGVEVIISKNEINPIDVL